MSDLVTNLAEATCCTRRELLGGKEHLVVPTVMLTPGIVNGEFVSAAEIAASVMAWNDVPIPIEHPRERGLPISARQPGVLERAVAGRLYGANIGPTGNLRGEMWLDIGKVGALGYAAMLELLEAGGPVEVSTAYYRDLDTTTTGTGFTGAAKNLKPDHLALLPHSKGACSWENGCGAPRLNEAEVNSDGEPDARTSAPAAPMTITPGGNKMEDDKTVVTNETTVVPELTPAPQPETVPAPAVNDNLVALAAVIEEFGGVAALREALDGLKVNRDNERAGLLTELTTNARVTFTPAELATWPTASLHKLADAVRPADYSGRGGPRTNAQDNGGWHVLVAPEVK
jgi:hypothetical protein